MGYRTDTLTIKSAAAYDLIALGGMGATEVAERWRVTEPTVTGHYNRAKRYYKEHPDERPVKPTKPGEKRLVRTVEVSKQELLEKVSNLSVRLLDSITDDDLTTVMRTLIDKARAGEPWAVRELLDRVFGRPNQPIEAMPPPDFTLTPEQRERARKIAERADAVD